VPSSPVVLSVNVGAPAVVRAGRRVSGIGKVPADEVEVADPGPKRRGPDGTGYSGVRGDFVGNGRHHGGAAQAVYAFAREELDHWERELDRTIAPGLFGENLTTAGIDVDAAEQGDTWRVGSAVLRVTGPRVPCATFAHRMAERAWVRRFAERGRSGCYLAVIVPGRVAAGDAILLERSGSGLPVPLLLAAWMGDLDAARAAMGNDALDGESRARFTKLLARATPAG
jgi:MOSC domain-containing protein YiiM